MAPIADIRMPKITADLAVSIQDTSNVLPQNSLFEKDVEILLEESNLTYFVNKKGFLLTDKINSINKPLYFKHTLNYPIYNFANTANTVLVTDKSGNVVSTDKWMFDCSNNSIYHSISKEDGIFYVVYPRADEDNNLLNPEYKELLETGPAFTEAEPKDLLNTGTLDPDADAYLIEEQNGQPYFWRLTLPRATKYFLKYQENGLLKIRILNTSQLEPWFVDIQNTVMLAINQNTNDFLRYTINEFAAQSFFPFPPYRFIANQKVGVMDKSIIDLNVQGLVISNKTPLDIKIYNPEGVLVKAITTDESKTSLFISGQPWQTTGIQSVDKSTGRIALTNKLNDGYYVLVSYYYKDDTYRYTSINFNPLFNPDILDQRIAILCKPSYTGCQKSISHIILSADNVILDASDIEIKQWAINKTLDDLIEDWLFIPEQTSNNNNYLMLGLISVINPLLVFDTEARDARRRGGGIIPSLIESALEKMPGAHQNWDIKYWDGPPLSLQSTIIIYLPEWVKNTYTEDEIKAKTSKYAQASHLIIVKYY